MAEFILKALVRAKGLEKQFFIDSAAVSSEEIGNPIYPPAARKLREKGVPVLPHRARQITRRDYEAYDLIIAMDEYNLVNLRRRLPDTAGKYRLLLSFTDRGGEVADPWYTGDFETAYRDILDGCRGLLSALTGDT